jgi:DNA invertase Pin-like site-specific DNA recombinase
MSISISINRTYGYARVSTQGQNLGRQIEALKEYGVDERFIFTDKESGKDFNRTQYQILKHALREGDLLIVKSLDRIGRNYREILKEWQDITHEIGTDIKILDMPLLDTTLHKDLLGSFISDLILQVLAYVAEQERLMTHERQAQGIAVAKTKGVHFGRPPVQYPENWNFVYQRWISKQITAKKAMQELNLKPTSFYKLAKSFHS